MEITKQMRRRILARTVFFAFVFLAIGASVGYYAAMIEMSNKFLTELSK